VGSKLEPAQMDALKMGQGVDLSHLIHAVKHESLWIVGAVVIVCVLYFVAMRLTDKNKA
jgi:bacteriorhodopsin